MLSLSLFYRSLIYGKVPDPNQQALTNNTDTIQARSGTTDHLFIQDTSLSALPLSTFHTDGMMLYQVSTTLLFASSTISCPI